MPEEDARQLVESIGKAAYFEEIVAAGQGKIVPKDAANWVLGSISRVINETGKSIAEIGIAAADLAELIGMLENKEISSSAGNTVFEELLKGSGKHPKEIVAEKGLAQVSDSGVLQQIVDQVVAANEKSVNDYRGGKTNALGYLVGQCMKASKGKGNPAIMREMLLKILNG